MFSASVSKSSFRLHSTDRLHSNRPEGDWLSGVAGWCGWLGSGQRKQLVAHEKTISGQRQSPGGRTCDAQRLKVRCPAAEGATSAGGEEERQERRDGARNYRKTPLEATCRQADSEVRYTRCSYHQCASQHIRKHLYASFCATNHLRDVLSVSFEESRWQIPLEHTEVAGASGRRDETKPGAAGKQVDSGAIATRESSLWAFRDCRKRA